MLSWEEVQRLLKATANLREEALLTMIYSAGLRASEAIRLKVSDILSDRGQIRVRGGKGKKDRYTVLADKTLSLLRRYYQAYRPGEWLFPGRDAATPDLVLPSEPQDPLHGQVPALVRAAKEHRPEASGVWLSAHDGGA